jgi:hypothetical protein
LSSWVWFAKPRAPPPPPLAYGYDLALHAVLIGFAALHASVALRVAGDLTAWDSGRMASGPLTILGLVAYIVVIARQIRRASRRP